VDLAASTHNLRRDSAGGMVGGVCSGLGARWGVDPLLLRIGFGVMTIAGGIGLPLYLVLWAVLPEESGAPSLGSRLRGRPGSWQVAAGAGCLVLAVMLTARELGLWWSDAIVWPLVLAASGGALLWRQSTAPPVAGRPLRERPAPGDVPVTTAAEVPSVADRARATYKGPFGVALVVGAGLLFLQAHGALNGARDVVLAVVVVAIGFGLVLAPFWLRLVRGLDTERAERIRSQERAEVAAHLHDSVLQTLALVQKRAEDPRAVAALARRQERELRSWLIGAPEARPDERLADALRAVAQEVEDQFGAVVEVITVGDRDLDDAGRALVAAAREALVNAARHAGQAGPVTLYAETIDGRTEVFVRDRGPGFDLATVPGDRRGVRESIVGRMLRHGGRAAVHSAPGGGTEVELVLEGRA
jgi:phage shock protein PspC (stress-responsive transcriptional regulator)/signal transduction histidine kinase